MKTTHYYETDVRLKRPYILDEWCERAMKEPDEKILQSDGRFRYYKLIIEQNKFIRVVTLEDGVTVHNAFFDRRYKPRTH